MGKSKQLFLEEQERQDQEQETIEGNIMDLFISIDKALDAHDIKIGEETTTPPDSSPTDKM